MSKSTLAILLAVLSFFGTAVTGFFTWSSTQEVERIKASSVKDLEVLRLNFEKYKKERESAEKTAIANQTEKSQRCKRMEELHSTMAQGLTSLFENDGIDPINKFNKLRANSVTAITFFGPAGEGAYARSKNAPLKQGEMKELHDLSAVVAALTMEIRSCNAQ